MIDPRAGWIAVVPLVLFGMCTEAVHRKGDVPYREQGEVELGRPVYLLTDDAFADPGRVAALAASLQETRFAEVVDGRLREILDHVLSDLGLDSSDVQIEYLPSIPEGVRISGRGAGTSSGSGRIVSPLEPQPAKGYALRIRLAGTIDALPELHAAPGWEACVREQDRRPSDAACIHAYVSMTWASAPGVQGFQHQAKAVGEAVVGALRGEIRAAARTRGLEPTYEHPRFASSWRGRTYDPPTVVEPERWSR